MATLDWSQCPAVESIPGKVSGAWVLKGTRNKSKPSSNLLFGVSIECLNTRLRCRPKSSPKYN